MDANQAAFDRDPVAAAGSPTKPATRFVGRRREVAQVSRLLATVRLVTLTGVGGSGKSRLALYVADRVQGRFTDGVRVVDLAALTDEALLSHQIAQTLAICGEDSRSVSDAVVDYLRDRELLLVLDTCEHLLDACARFAHLALRAAGGLRLLCTSRQPLRIMGEHLFVVAPLPLPEPDSKPVPGTIARYAALTLFLEHARTVAPEFTITATNQARVVDICRRLDGLPLAIELAAAALRTLPVEALDRGLQARPGLPGAGHPPLTRQGPLTRHDTLEATFDWSHALCSPAERLLWARVSVFAGGFELEAAEQICADDALPKNEVLHALAGLIDKSVVTVEDDADRRRYRLLDTVRRYGIDRLRSGIGVDGSETVGEVALRLRHRDHYLALAERFDAERFGALGQRQSWWTRRIRAEHANLRAALGHCLASAEEIEAGLRLAGSLYFFWIACGALHEGLYWLERALAAAEPRPSPGWLRALAGYPRLLIARGGHAAAVPLARQSVELARQLDEPLLLAEGLENLGLALLFGGGTDVAVTHLEEAVRVATGLGPAHTALASANAHLASALIVQGDPARAAELCERATAICRIHDDQWQHGRVLIIFATAALALGEVTDADRYAREALRLHRAVGDSLGVTVALERLAWIAAAGHDYRHAALRLGAADRQWRDIGTTLYGSASLLREHDRCRTATRQALGNDAFQSEFRRGARLTVDQAVASALGRTRSTGEGPSSRS